MRDSTLSFTLGFCQGTCSFFDFFALDNYDLVLAFRTHSLYLGLEIEARLIQLRHALAHGAQQRPITLKAIKATG